jgi:primosomal protein N' (replication factor Y)
MASFAEVSVNSPFGGRETYCYAIPLGTDVTPGQAVLVPFGDKILQGIVIEVTDAPSVPLEKIRPLSLTSDTRPVLFPHQLALARWVSSYYLSPLFDAVALMLPPGFERRSIAYISLTDKVKSTDLFRLPESQQSAVEILKESASGGEIPLSEIEKRLGLKSAQSAVSALVEKGLAVRRYEFEPVRVKPKMEAFLRLSVSVEEARAGLEKFRRGSKVAALLEFLIEWNEAVPWSLVRERVNCNPPIADSLVEKGFIKIEHAAVNREPVSYDNLPGRTPSTPPVLSGAQKHALERIRASLDKTPAPDSRPDVFLLHGVTGSGKTEVYLQALAEVVKRGKRGIVLVPEIALTPQTVERFAARFPKRVAVLHSRLSLGEQYDEWRRIRDGEFDVVIGARSAIFAPQPDLGLIVIDEEHEWTYKQSDKSPRYHTRDVALKLAALTNSLVILGTATPDIVSFHRAQRGRYHLLSLPERVSPYHGSPMPQITTVDMRAELKAGNRSLISASLKQAVDAAIARGEQVILFLNRRGTASFVQCRSCGYVLRCRRCNVPLTYHAAGETLICHQCNYRMNVQLTCPGCGSPNISYLGAGTQKLEEEVKEVFPQSRIIRWDSDSAARKNAHAAIAAKFRNREADILVGTQMVASGLDFPGVSVVGVVSADFALNLPDFRAGERTFQLLMQVAGRAGRGTPRAAAIIQTYSPENYAVKAAALGDYRAFYEKEIAYRRELVNPPMSRLVALMFSHINEAACRKEAERLKKQIAETRDSEGIAGLSIIGPAPAFIPRLRGRYRYQMVLRSVGRLDFLARLQLPKGWTVDVDPVGLI